MQNPSIFVVTLTAATPAQAVNASERPPRNPFHETPRASAYCDRLAKRPAYQRAMTA
jgi:hypothetical protein